MTDTARKPRASRFSPTDVEAMRAQRAAGSTYAEIAAAWSCSTAYAFNLVGPTPKRPPKPPKTKRASTPSPENNAAILADYETGMSYREVAAAWACSCAHVQRVVSGELVRGAARFSEADVAWMRGARALGAFYSQIAAIWTCSVEQVRFLLHGPTGVKP